MATTRACAAALSASHLIVLPDARHPWQKPFDEVVLSFLDELEEQAPPGSAGSSGVAAAETIPLSPREIEVLRLIANGSTNAEIAESLIIAPGTVARHVTNILNKTALRNRVELTRYAVQYGLIDG